MGGGVALLTGAILSLATVNISAKDKSERANISKALIWAVLGGILVAVYTIYDAYGIRATANPFTFLAWFFFLDGLIMPFVAYKMWQKSPNRPDIAPLMKRGFLGGIIAYFSFGSIMIATRIDSVGEAAVLRETSPIFAALIGWFFLKEKVGPKRTLIIALIALGAVLVEFGKA